MVKLPESPTKEILDILAWSNFNEEMKIAREEQIKLGLEIVPPNCEMEIAAAKYRKLYNYLKEQSK